MGAERHQHSDKRVIVAVLIAIVAASLTLDLFLYALMGFRLGGDSPRYLTGVTQLLNGESLSFRQQAYVGYIVVLAALRWLGLPMTAIYSVQVLITAAAAVAAFYLGRAVGGLGAGVACGLIWALFFDIHRWNFYVLTDAVFISSVMVSCCLFMRALDRGTAAMVPRC